jgi:hypothetical protein
VLTKPVGIRENNIEAARSGVILSLAYFIRIVLMHMFLFHSLTIWYNEGFIVRLSEGLMVNQ